MNDPILEDLINFYLDLKKTRFWGNINITFQDGQVAQVKKEQIFKVKDLNTVSIQIRSNTI